MRTEWFYGGGCRKFQSTLPVAGERCGLGCGLGASPPEFQSTLPVAGERCRTWWPRTGRRIRVSIHAPRCRGAMREVVPFSIHRYTGFNPRSPLPGSDARNFRGLKQTIAVSIHAPRCRGAMHYGRVFGMTTETFQSTLPVAGERCGVGRARNPNMSGVSIHAPRCRGAMPHLWHCIPHFNTRFNPRSPLPGSDATLAISYVCRVACFNPRSPLPGSDAFACSPASCDRPKVSIHAPRCRGAMQGADYRQTMTTSFNPRSPLPGSDALASSSQAASKCEFQSTLPVAGERCPGKEDH